MIRLEIIGRPASNKNSRRIIIKGRGGKPLDHPISLPSAAYERFSKDAIKQIWEQVRKQKGPGQWEITTPVQITYIFNQKGRMYQDGANAKQSIDDVLEASGLIKNDRQIKQFHGYIVDGCMDWVTIVEIEEC